MQSRNCTRQTTGWKPLPRNYVVPTSTQRKIVQLFWDMFLSCNDRHVEQGLENSKPNTHTPLRVSFKIRYHISDYVTSKGLKTLNSKLANIWKETVISWRDWRKPRWPSVRASCLRDDIWTRDLRNTKLGVLKAFTSTFLEFLRSTNSDHVPPPTPHPPRGTVSWLRFVTLRYFHCSQINSQAPILRKAVQSIGAILYLNMRLSSDALQIRNSLLASLLLLISTLTGPRVLCHTKDRKKTLFSAFETGGPT